MDIDQSIKIIEQQNRKLFSATHTWLIVIGISAIAFILTLTIPPIPAALITGISAFFVLYHHVAYSIKNINARITLMETRNKTK